MSCYEPLSEPEPAGPGVWLGGELSTPPDAAEIHRLPRCAALPDEDGWSTTRPRRF
jgi:hypothetical protein